MRRLLRNKGQLEARLRNSSVDVLLVQETWLSPIKDEEIRIQGFYEVGRVDRISGKKRGYGGVAVFARNGFTSIGIVKKSSDSERQWCILHTHLGGILLGNWYRAPDDLLKSIASFPNELAEMDEDCIGTIVTGDLNIHHQRWLTHSYNNTPTGQKLWEICQEAGLQQLVREPTRGKYLLDLVLTDLSDITKVTILPEVADHKIVCIDIDIAVPLHDEQSRQGWDFVKTDWPGL